MPELTIDFDHLELEPTDINLKEFLKDSVSIISDMKSQHEETVRHIEKGVKHFNSYCAPGKTEQNIRNVSDIINKINAVIYSKDKINLFIPNFSNVATDVNYINNIFRGCHFTKVDDNAYICMPLDISGKLIDCEYRPINKVMSELLGSVTSLKAFLEVKEYNQDTITIGYELFDIFIGIANVVMKSIPSEKDINAKEPYIIH